MSWALYLFKGAVGGGTPFLFTVPAMIAPAATLSAERIDAARNETVIWTMIRTPRPFA